VCPPTRTHAVSSFRFFPVPQTKNQETYKTLAEFPRRLRDEQQDRTRWNQLALFRLWFCRVLERLHGCHHQVREASRKRLTSITPVGVRPCNHTWGRIKSAMLWRGPYGWNFPAQFIISLAGATPGRIVAADNTRSFTNLTAKLHEGLQEVPERSVAPGKAD
jgi:hypothetical protein